MDSSFTYSTDVQTKVSSEKLSEAIVDYVESVIPSILTEVEAHVPTDDQLRLESLRLKLKSRRMRQGNRTSVLEHLRSKQAFVHYINALKQKRGRFNLDSETNLPISTSISYDRNTVSFEETQARPINTLVTRPQEIFRDNIMLTELQWDFLTQSARFSNLPNEHITNLTIDPQITFKSDPRFENRILDDLEKRIRIGGEFTLADLADLKETHNYPTEQGNMQRVMTIVEDYVELIKKRTSIDCFEEFLQYEKTLPYRSQTPPLKKNTLGLIKAATLYEFRRAVRLLGSEFLESRITYEDYLKKVDEYTSLANRICV